MSTTGTLQIAVVGHTNAGKTSLLRTLTRRVDFGQVSPQPGTTRHVEQVELRIDGRAAVRFFDTPGLEDAVALLAHVNTLVGADGAPVPSRPERIRLFLQGPEAQASFEQEAKVLRKMLEVDAAFLVIDAREPVLPKFQAEIELLNSCARPVLPVLNFVSDPASREAAWREALSAGGLHAVVRFDAAAPFTGAERDLYNDLGTLLPAQRGALRDVTDFLQREVEARRQAACTQIAQHLVQAAALRRSVAAHEFDDPGARAKAVQALRDDTSKLARRGIDELLALYGFRKDDAAEAPLPPMAERWSMDLFNPEALKQVGLRLGKGAAVGAAIGVVADLAVGGISLGAGAALGGAVGGALAQGWGPLGRKLMHRLQGVQELTVDDGVLALLALGQLRLVRTLEQRGHAATERIEADHTQLAITAPPPLALALQAAQPARSHAEWESPPRWRGASAEQQAVVDAVARALQQALQVLADEPVGVTAGR